MAKRYDMHAKQRTVVPKSVSVLQINAACFCREDSGNRSLAKNVCPFKYSVV